MISRCGECGSKDIKVKNIRGTKYPWKDFPAVELVGNQDALVCQKCGNQILSSKDIKKLEKNIRYSLHEKTIAALLKLVKEFGLTQEQLAKSLGVTPVYVSMVKNKKKILSFTAFNLLQSYAKFPQLMADAIGIDIFTTTAQTAMQSKSSIVNISKRGIAMVIENPRQGIASISRSMVQSKFKSVYRYGIVDKSSSLSEDGNEIGSDQIDDDLYNSFIKTGRLV